jgi:hypothetical protein
VILRKYEKDNVGGDFVEIVENIVTDDKTCTTTTKATAITPVSTS